MNNTSELLLKMDCIC